MTEKKYTKADLLEREVKNLKDQNSDEHKNILEEIACINEKLDKGFVTRAEFEPVRSVVWGIVSLVLIAVGGALIRLIITQ
jgi:hypothetical protein